MEQRVLGYIAEGAWKNEACLLAGIARTMHNWLERAEAGKQTYKGFAERLEEAERQANHKMLQKWVAGADEDWRAARDYLARKEPRLYSTAAEQLAVFGGRYGLTPVEQATGLQIILKLGDEPAPQAPPAIDVTPSSATPPSASAPEPEQALAPPGRGRTVLDRRREAAPVPREAADRAAQRCRFSRRPGRGARSELTFSATVGKLCSTDTVLSGPLRLAPLTTLPCFLMIPA